MTTLQMRELRRLVGEDGRTLASAVRTIGVPYHTAWHFLRRHGVKLPRKHWDDDRLAQYGAYDRNDGVLVALGTAREVAAACGIKIGTFWSCKTRNNGKYEFVKLEEDA